jgi:hypothetical protein
MSCLAWLVQVRVGLVRLGMFRSRLGRKGQFRSG